MKKFLCIILSAVMALSLTGCAFIDKINAVIEELNATPVPEISVTDAPATEEPEGSPDPEANSAFEEFDLAMFRELVTSGADSFNQLIAGDPSVYGIDPDEVPHTWGDYTYDAHLESMDFYREQLDELAKIPREGLTKQNRYAYDAIKKSLEVSLLYEDYYYFEEPLTPMNGMHSMLPLSMICFSIRKPADVESYVDLIEDMPRFLGQIEQFETEKAEKGLFMCETALDQVIESCRSFAEKGSSSFLISYFNEIAEQARALGMPESEIEAFAERNRTAVLEGILPAYTRLADTLETHRSDCGQFVGAALRSAEEKAYFELKVRDGGASMDDMDTIVQLLEKMGDSVYYELMDLIYSGGNSLLAQYGNDMTFGSVQENLDWLKGFIGEYYPACPDYSLKFVTVPDDIADDFSPAAYLTAAIDDHYDNVMLINPASEGSDDLLTTAHETIPGHMYQCLYMRNTEGLSLTQQLIEPTGYAEAWTVFTEHFVAEHCYDLGSDFCLMMNTESTFCNIFLPAYVSIKVNCDGWNIKDVRKYLKDTGMEDAADIYYEYAVTMPDYAMSYAIGYAYLMEIYKEAAPKGSEEIKAFFTKYLSFGPDYMDVIRDRMKAQ